MQVRDVIAAVDRLAPFALAEPWDQVGLQVGSPSDELPPDGLSDSPAVLVALEVDDATLDEAVRIGAGVIVAHHPLIFDPLDRLSDDTEAGRLALRAAREGVAVVAAHTNLDKAHGGMADIAVDLIGLQGAQPLQPAAAEVLKLIGFVPEDAVDLVRKALFAAGAGVIGDYEHCSWSVTGQGTFFGGEGTSPVAGVAGRDEEVVERRLEVVVPRRLRRRVIAAYVGAHPYEEPAFDIMPLENEVASLGLGRLGALPAVTTLADLVARVAAALRLPSLRYAGDGSREVRRVAVLPGSGGEAIARGVGQIADVLITGDVKYHEARAAQAQGLALIDAPHGVFEQEGVLKWAERLSEALSPAATVITFRNPAVAVWIAAEAAGASAAEASGVPAPAEAAGASAAGKADPAPPIADAQSSAPAVDGPPAGPPPPPAGPPLPPPGPPPPPAGSS
jgi:dinuclear metal center YbgI/SA1388 family protein